MTSQQTSAEYLTNVKEADGTVVYALARRDWSVGSAVTINRARELQAEGVPFNATSGYASPEDFDTYFARDWR